MMHSPWLIWFSAGLFYLFEFIHRVIISVMLPELSATLQVSAALASTLSAAYFYAYGLAQIPIGIILDRTSARTVLTIACSAIALASFVLANTLTVSIAIIARAVIGLGSATAFVCCLKLGNEWFAREKFPLIVGLTNLLGVAGALLGGSPAAYALQSISWQQLTQILGWVGLALSVGLWLIIRDKPAAHTPIKSKQLMISLQRVGVLAVFAGLIVAPIVIYSELWAVAFLTSKLNLSRELAANLSTSTFGGIAIGGPMIGWIAQFYPRLKLLMLAGLLGAASCFALIIYGPISNIASLYTLHILFGFFSSSMLLSFTLGTRAVSASQQATSIAVINTVIMVMGAIGQSISGFLMDYSSFNYAISLLPIFVGYGLALVLLLGV